VLTYFKRVRAQAISQKMFFRFPEERDGHLKLDPNLSLAPAPLSQREIDGMDGYLSSLALPSRAWEHFTGTLTFPMGACQYQHMAGKLYMRTRDERFLNHLVRMADTVANGGRYQLGKSRLNYEAFGWGMYPSPIKPTPLSDCRGPRRSDNSTIPSPLGYGVLNVITVAARIISEHPDMWDKKVSEPDLYKLGNTYRERAMFYIDLASTVIEKGVLEGALATDRNTPVHVVDRWTSLTAFNRLFMFIRGVVDCAQALDGFAIHPKSKAIMDDLVRSSLREYVNSCHYYEKDGRPVISWPYASSQGLLFAEDTGHAGITIGGVSAIYETGRYNDILTEEFMTRMANAVRYVLYDEKTGKMAANIKGKPKVHRKNERVYEGEAFGEVFLSLSRFCPEIYDIIAKDHHRLLEGKDNYRTAWRHRIFQRYSIIVYYRDYLYSKNLRR